MAVRRQYPQDLQVVTRLTIDDPIFLVGSKWTPLLYLKFVEKTIRMKASAAASCRVPGNCS